MIAEGMCLIYKKAVLQKSFNRGELSLLRPWMQRYLRHSSAKRGEKLLDVLADTLTAFHRSSPCEEYFSAMKQHVMPFVNEKYFDKAAAPSCIPRIAARMVMHCASSNTNNDRITTSFEMYVNCPDACADQVLAYMKEITQCSNTLAAIDQTVIIRQWLKMGILHDAKSLLDLTRIVHGLDVLKALCEIPEKDMFHSDAIPVKLFFRFVGLRYRQADASARMGMKKKLYTIFEDFDKWFPDPAGVIRMRIFAVLILALKECPLAFYLRINSKCLYSIAFHHFFLPFCVLVDRNVQQDFIEAIAKIWHHVMDFLGYMDYRNDQIIGDNVYNMMNKWIPQFTKLTNVKQALRPVMLFFSARNEDFVMFVMTRFVQTFVDLKRCLPNAYSVEVMEILKHLIKNLAKQKDYGKITLFIRTTGLSVTQHAFMCNEKYHSRLIASEILFDLLASTNEPSNLIKLEMRNVLIAFTLKYFPVSEECYIKFMTRFVFRYPNFFRSLIDCIRREVAKTEITCAQNKTDGVLSQASYLLERELNTKLKSNNVK
ncbi:protein MMS22-like isoform X2 [Anopheles moucheti]|nr:protein MMS22-like isoform X2 [Anopheles moucheti]